MRFLILAVYIFVQYRKGLKSVVLERSDSLRSTGAAIGVLANGWRALEELGVASKLRMTADFIAG